MHHIVDGDRSASGQGEIGFGLRMAVRLERFTLAQANHSDSHVVLAPGTAAEQLFPLRLAARGYLIGWPAGPLKRIKVLGGGARHRAAFIGWGLPF
jgi:hypothetical protein